MMDVIIFHFGPFLALLPSNSPNQNLNIMKKKPREIIIWHKCTKNHDHMLNFSWDRAHDRFNFYFSFWAIFCPFLLFYLTAQKIKILKKWKKNTWRYHHFTYMYHKLWSDDVQFLRYGAQQTDGQTDRQTDRKSDT